MNYNDLIELLHVISDRKISYRELCNNCREFRINVLHLTQEEVAADMHVTKSAVSRWERGERVNTKFIEYFIERGMRP